ncbi:MAG: hypothetical protein MZV64_29125 [Ignavibacteriales bacterium]|nr:hypothetical protein [Ignavibacteriales bacterium]
MQRGTYTIIKTIALDKNLIRNGIGKAPVNMKNTRDRDSMALCRAILISTAKMNWLSGPLLSTTTEYQSGILDLSTMMPGISLILTRLARGMEIFYGIESRSPKNGVCLVDAATGEIICYDGPTTHVHSQGMVGDIDPEYLEWRSMREKPRGRSAIHVQVLQEKRLSDKKHGIADPKTSLVGCEDDLKEVNINNQLLKFKGDTLMKIEGKVVMVADS